MPATDIAFTRDYMLTCDFAGHLKCWWKAGAQTAPADVIKADKGASGELR